MLFDREMIGLYDGKLSLFSITIVSISISFRSDRLLALGPFTYYVMLFGGKVKNCDNLLQGGVQDFVTFSINELFFKIFDKI